MKLFFIYITFYNITILKCISPTQYQLINNSLTSDLFPDCVKIAKVVFIYKEGYQSVISNYRPISVRAMISKIFEKLVYKQLYNYLERHNNLIKDQ